MPKTLPDIRREMFFLWRQAQLDFTLGLEPMPDADDIVRKRALVVWRVKQNDRDAACFCDLTSVIVFIFKKGGQPVLADGGDFIVGSDQLNMVVMDAVPLNQRSVSSYKWRPRALM